MTDKVADPLASLDAAQLEVIRTRLEEIDEIEKEEKKRAIREKEVKQIWAALDSGNYHATQRDRVAYLLKNYPDTRESDITLTLRYWREFQPDIYTGDAVNPYLLFKLERLTTIARLRAKIQNEYRLFRGSDEVQHKRRQKEAEVKESMINDHAPPPVIHIYADETGKNGDFLIVGSVWFLNISRVSSFQIAVGAMENRAGKRAQEFHFSNCGSGELDRYKKFIDLAAERLEYVVFKAILLPRKGLPRKVESAIASMLRMLIVTGYDQEVNSRRVTPPRTIELMMDEGGLHALDRHELPELTTRALIDGHGDQHALTRVTEIDSATCVAIQLADIFCGALNRRFNEKQSGVRRPKDELADYFFEKLQPRVSEMSPDETLKLINLT